MSRLETITRPNGKPYRPRKIAAYTVVDEDEILCGVIVLGTHEIGRAQPFADEYVAWQLGANYAAEDPVPGWYREGFLSGRFMWIDDIERGRAGVWFRKIIERV